MKKFGWLFCYLMFSALQGVFCTAIDAAMLPKGAVAVVDGGAIDSSRLDFLMAQMPSHVQKGSPQWKQAYEHIREQLVRSQVVYNQAKREGFEKDRNYLIAKSLAEQDALVRVFIEHFIETHPVSDAVLRQEYQALKDHFGTTDFHLAHILVKSDVLAKKIIVDLQKGKKFEDLAHKYSIDSSSQKHGGDLGWNALTVYVDPFAKAVSQLKVGEFTSEAVKTQFGYHIIKLIATRPLKVPSFEQVKPQLLQAVRQKDLQKYLTQLRKDATVVM